MIRNVSRTDTTPPPAPGFIGEGHTAVEVVRPTALAASDPFVLLMDDRLDILRRRQIGGAHPHAGLETVTLVLEGVLSDRDLGAGEPLVQQGPFVAGSPAEILDFHRRFRAGHFASMSELARAPRAERRSA